MDLGLYCNRFSWSEGGPDIRSALVSAARQAEDAGFASFWVMDHFFQLPRHGAIDDPMLEAYSVLSFIAAVTDRMRLGALVTGVTYRHPGALIKTATSLDVLSGGRSVLGIGAAWFDREHLGLGIPFPPLAERFERLEEMLQIAHHMWSGNVLPFHGKHYQLEEPISQPRPVQKPHPPILIGGRGERKTLKFVAKYGSACNFSLFDRAPDLSANSALDEVRRKLDVLRNHCDIEGRPYTEIERTVVGWLPVRRESQPGCFTPDEALTVLRRYAELGIDHVMIASSTLFPGGFDPDTFALFRDELVPAAWEIVPAGRG